MIYREFIFGSEQERELWEQQKTGKKNVAYVTENMLYDGQRGFGFVTEGNCKQQELLRLPELNSGFDIAYWYGESELTGIVGDKNGCLAYGKSIAGHGFETIREDGNRQYIPLCFKANVVRLGNYQVTVTMTQGNKNGKVILFAGPRRMVFMGDVEANHSVTKTFCVNVCDIIPRGKETLHERRSIDLALVGEEVYLSEVQIKEVNCPTIYIAGDSTVTDQPADYPYAPATSYAGWGQMLSAFCKEKAAVSNHSHSGLTTESFRSEGHYAVIQAHMKQGDYILIQFAHNDQKLEQLKAQGGFKDNILNYIDEAKMREAFPILITPLARNSWKALDGQYNDLLKEYADAVKEIGASIQVPVVDLHQRSMDFIMEHGLEASKAYFFPDDYTHSNDYGAYYWAGVVKEELVKVCKKTTIGAYKRLAQVLDDGFGTWMPPEKIVPPEAPVYLKDIKNPNETELFENLERPDEILTRAEACDMVMQAARFFRTNVFNDIFTDIVGHEWYAGAVQCAYQNGIIMPQMIVNHELKPLQQVTKEEFILFLMNGYKSRKGLPQGAQCPLDQQCKEYSVPFVRVAYQLGILSENVSLKEDITRQEAAEYCRKLHI